MKKAKQAEIDASATQVKQKTQDAADAANKLAESKENLESTREALGADKQFLSELKLRCQQTDKDFELRTKARADEIAAVSEAIAILSDDDAKENFDKTLSFVQVDQTLHFSQRSAQLARTKGAEVLLEASRRTGSAALTSLAVRAKAAMNPKTFAKVEGAIDDTVKELKKVQADEVVQKEKCVADLRVNDKEIMLKNREIKEYTSFIEEAESTVTQLEKEIEIHYKQVKEAETQMKIASEEREAQNKEFQTAVTEQRAAQDVLKKALARLKAFYKEKSLMQQPSLAQEMGFSLIQGKQTPGAAAPPPPPGFEKFEQNKGSSGVMMLIENVIEDAASMEKDAMKAETDAQAAYVEFITNSNAAIKGDKDAVAMKTEQKTQTIADKETTEADRAAALKDAENLYKTKADLHQSCDFLIENFDVRQHARIDEMEALEASKQMFHGADVGF